MEEISIKDILYTLKKKWWLIFITGLIGCTGAYIFSILTYTPLYVANASMVINSKQPIVINGETILSNDISISQKMVNTYSAILISDNVLEKVNTNMNQTISPSTMRNYITVSSPENSEVIMIKVSHPDSQIAMTIANEMMHITSDVITETVGVGTIMVLDTAKLPMIPVPPQHLLYTFIGLFLGLMLGVGFIFIIETLFPKIRSKTEISDTLFTNVLSEIPRNRNSKNSSVIPLITGNNCELYFIESFKLLAMQIKKISYENHYKKFLITSSLENEGKTTVSGNLALTLAAMGSSVLFIETDIHKSNVFNYLKENSLIAKNITDKKYANLLKFQDSKLYLISLKSKKIKQLFNEHDIRDIIARYEDDFDYIIIDSPPAFIISDAASISKYVDGVIFVVKQEKTSREIIIETKEILKSIGANIIGCVLNDVNYSMMDYITHYKYIYTDKYMKNSE